MTANINQMNCPACGAPVEISKRVCEFCHGPVIISTFRSVYEMPISSMNAPSPLAGQLFLTGSV